MIRSTFSHYRILELLGAGGMGAVYRARDSQLERDVALKVLPPEDFADPTARARLLREARTASQLNHPHICTIHEVGEADGVLYIAMELVHGQPLNSLIPSGGLPLESVLRYGAQIADALAHAHQRGVIHRDLKTANVVVTSEGRAKVLDFGLAKRLFDPAEGEPLRPSVALTETGALVGTPHYLAPELLRGARADARSDLWALGVLLYEMAAGRMPFAGATTPELCAAILNEAMAPLPERVPAGLRSVIQRCLAKEPGQRFHSAAEVRAALEALQSDHYVPKAIATPGLRRWMVPSGLALLVVVASFVGWRLWKRSSQPYPSPAAESHGWKQLTFVGNAEMPAISPDGRTIAYAVAEAGKEFRVMVQDVMGGEALEIFTAPRIWGLQWSPTGSDILVSCTMSGSPMERLRGESWLVPRMGGQARSVSSYGAWARLSSDGAFLAQAFMHDRRIRLTRLAGGDTSEINLTPKFTWLLDVAWSPDGRMLMFCVSDDAGSSVWTMQRDGRMQRKVYEASAEIRSVRWAPRGGAIYCLRQLGYRGELVKIYLDRDGSPSRRAPRVLISEPGFGSGVGPTRFEVSSDGRLVCARTVKHANLWLCGLPHGRERGTPPRQLTHGTAHITSPTLSPDGDHVAFLSNRNGSYNVHVLSLAGEASRQLTFMERDVHDGLAWSPDGESIAFTASDGDTVRVWRTAVGGGAPVPFKRTLASRQGSTVAWWPGKKLLYQTPGNRNFNVLDPVTGVEHPLVQNDSVGWMFEPAWSPDGKHVAVSWNRRQPPRGLWVVSAQESAQHLLASPTPASSFAGTYRWARDGKALYYVPYQSPWRLARVSFPQGDTTTLIRAPFEKLNEDEAWSYLDFTPDLRRFVYAAGQSSSDVWLLENFDPEVK